MPRYAAFLRGVSPMNAKMHELARALERAGFGDVKTVLASGNVVFDADGGAGAAIERAVEAAIAKHARKDFTVFVRSVASLRRLVASDPYARFRLPAAAKRVVTFLRAKPKGELALPIERQEARVLAVEGTIALSAYVPQPGNPAFMALLEKTFGKEITTRTWDTVKKVIR